MKCFRREEVTDCKGRCKHCKWKQNGHSFTTIYYEVNCKLVFSNEIMGGGGADKLPKRKNEKKKEKKCKKKREQQHTQKRGRQDFIET